MNTQTRSATIKQTKAGFLAIILVVLLLSACSSKSREDKATCRVDMGVPVTINVTDVKPKVFFDQLASQLGCAITVSPFVRKHVTLQVENAPVFEVLANVYSQIGCKDILYEDHLAIKPLTIMDKIRAKQWEEFKRMMEERRRIHQTRLPEGTTFEDVPLSSVLEEISRVSGLNIKPWEEEGDRKVTIEVSGMTVEEAIKAVLLYVDGEGAVLIEQKYFLHHSWGQYWNPNWHRQTIVEAEADYVLSVEENQGQLYEDISVLFAVDQAHDFKYASFEHAQTTNKNHGRIEVRECWSTSNPEYLSLIRGLKNWSGLQTIAMVLVRAFWMAKEPDTLVSTFPVCPVTPNAC